MDLVGDVVEGFKLNPQSKDPACSPGWNVNADDSIKGSLHVVTDLGEQVNGLLQAVLVEVMLQRLQRLQS
jgi:hypothetical protein